MNQIYPYYSPGGQYAPPVAPPPQANAFKTHIQEDFGSILGVRLSPDEVACIFFGKRLHTVPFKAVREGYPYLYLFPLDQLAGRRLNSEYRMVKVANRAYWVVYKAGRGAGKAYASSIEELFVRVQQELHIDEPPPVRPHCNYHF